MAHGNYGKIRTLKPYKGAEIERLTSKDGGYMYLAYMGDGAVICERSLKELKRSVKEYDDAELC